MTFIAAFTIRNPSLSSLGFLSPITSFTSIKFLKYKSFNVKFDEGPNLCRLKK